ncbi:DUF4175 domain-containing protein [Pedobacter hiemivivus]|uniref:DUF4175 domain-containing protein n=1 Tax=Pedobacter hiemivivus TaxID=2530454 RepID=A0A4U1G636_9SPHI|nr:DUF4175 domain-containing protein [Pedobacter hiemivivus]TKC59231.1 DUF4175 domain-containing protein [Pedobacter hiemivivus]
MNTIDIKKPVLLPEFKHLSNYLLFGLLLLLWLALPKLMGFDETTGYIDPTIWLLIVLALITFLVLLATCWWLLQRFWMALGLPGLGLMVSQFKFLELWQQLGFYFACFALLLLAGVGCLAAVL